MQMTAPYNHDVRLCKMLVVGEQNVGKTCLVCRYVQRVFKTNTKMTIGADFALKEIRKRDLWMDLQLWDIAGQERYGQLLRVYYTAAEGALVVYDCTRNETFEAAKKWKIDIDRKVFLPDGSPIPCILVANKCDLEVSPKRTPEEMDAVCAENGFIGWIATSSKENINVDEAFSRLVDRIVDISKKGEDADNQNESIRLDSRGKKNSANRTSCCGGQGKAARR